MKTVCLSVLGAVLAMPAFAEAQALTDIYHVHFTKAVPGQAAQLGEELKKPYPTDPMPDHVLVLRHQEGADWDYCVVTHMGTKATIEAGPAPAAAASLSAMSAWHTDSYVLGPSWGDFSKAMGITDGPSSGASIYTVAVWRELAGHRKELHDVLEQQGVGAKVPTGRVLLQHAEGGPWTYIVLARFNSWQDFATDQAGQVDVQGWAAVRAQSTYHQDTLADRISQR